MTNGHLLVARPRKAVWVMHTPPMLLVTGPSTNPLGMTGPSWRIFRGCARDAMEDVVILGPSAWLEAVTEVDADRVVTGSHWRVHVGAVEVGRVAGYTSPFAAIRLD